MHAGRLPYLAAAVLAAAAFTLQLSGQTVITVTAQGTAAVRDVQISNSSGIQFLSNATFPVAITFTASAGTEFGNIASIASGQTSGFQVGRSPNITVNYTITNLTSGQVRGPYRIQIGTGPIQINISGGWPDLDTIEVPANGQIQFNSDAAYTLTCGPAPSISPNLASLQPGLNPVQTLEANFSGCSIGSNEPVPGNGTVHIGS